MSQKIINLLPQEIRLATKWAFRAAQLPAGYSVAAMNMVEYGEIFHRVGLLALQEFLTTDIDPSPKRTDIESETEQATVLNANGESVLICGSGALDLACARTMQRGLYVVCVKNVRGGFSLLEQLADAAAQRHLICALMFHTDQPKNKLTNPTGTILAIPDQTAPIIIEANLSRPSHLHQDWLRIIDQNTAKNIWPENSEADPEQRLIESISQTLTPGTPPLSIFNNFSLICFKPKTPEQLTRIKTKLLQHCEQMPTGSLQIHSSQQRAAIYQTAIRQGVPTNEAVWFAIKTFGHRILVPTPQRKQPVNSWSKRDSDASGRK